MNGFKNQFLLNLASKNTRLDNRGPEDFRKIEIEKGVIENAEGSSRVKVGKTDIIVGVKLDVGSPFADRPDEGVLMTGAELSPLAHPEFETGPPRAEAIELARVVDRGIRESGALDIKKLCIKKGEKVWMVFVDIHIINQDGNMIDTAMLAAVEALWDARIPKYDPKTELVEYGKRTKDKLPMKHKPVAVTFAKLGESIFVDPNTDEEAAMDTRLTVTTKDDGNLCALQKGGFGTFSVEEINKAFEISAKLGKQIRKKF